jgi:predicted Rossmann fold nucleotide-binding protein DprA/Smf involved in DNA uptake
MSGGVGRRLVRMTAAKPALLQPTDAHWPTQLSERLGSSAPRVLHAIGPLALLAGRRTALFCSARTPGDAILRAHDAARRMRDAGVTVISGFHSPIEKDCLRILLRGNQPIIVCPARAIEGMRIPPEWRAAFEAGRLLFLSPFTERPDRVTQGSALRRNEVVTALADEGFIAHITPGGRTEQMAEMLRRWGVRLIPNGCGIAR